MGGAGARRGDARFAGPGRLALKLAFAGAGLLDLLLPAGCGVCRAWVPGGRDAPQLCTGCRARLRRSPWPRCRGCDLPLGTGRAPGDACRECASWPPGVGARHAYAHEAPASDLVHALKYEGRSELARFMGSAMAALDVPDRLGGGARLVVPVPTTSRRLRIRGYNQAEMLARRVAEARGLPLADLLLRSGDRPSQTSLSPRERRDNVAGAFAVTQGRERELRNGDVVLVDDVLTTGATACEAASTILAAGARSVTVLTFARALPSLGGV